MKLLDIGNRVRPVRRAASIVYDGERRAVQRNRVVGPRTGVNRRVVAGPACDRVVEIGTCDRKSFTLVMQVNCYGG